MGLKHIQIVPIIILTLLFAGCDSRKCLRSHQETIMIMQPIYGANGNLLWMYPMYIPESVCDQYEEEVKNGK